VVCFPEGFRLEELRSDHPRAQFDCASTPTQQRVNAWLATEAMQSQKKRLSKTQVLIAPDGIIAGFYTLAMGQVDFGQLPAELTKKLPKRAVPVAVLAWLGVDKRLKGQRLGERLLAQALAECHQAGRTFPFVALILDCIDEDAKRFYQRWDFREVPGRPLRLYLTAQALDTMMAATSPS
jgi:GNAT superfamily N-acetyltransferase